MPCKLQNRIQILNYKAPESKHLELGIDLFHWHLTNTKKLHVHQFQKLYIASFEKYMA